LDAATARFRATIARMNALPSPPTLRYQARIRTDGGTVSATTAKVVFFPGGVFSPAAPDEVELQLTSAGVPSPILDPTWSSAFGWMQHRSLLVRRAPPPSSTLDVTLPTIAVVAAAPAVACRVVSERSGTCPNGDRGWQQRVVPLRDPDMHPLVGTIIDERTELFCVLEFEESIAAGDAMDAQGLAELRFQSAASYYVVTSAHLIMHVQNASGVARMSADISLDDFEALR
jgi:hypothetical protein